MSGGDNFELIITTLLLYDNLDQQVIHYCNGFPPKAVVRDHFWIEWWASENSKFSLDNLD